LSINSFAEFGAGNIYESGSRKDQHKKAIEQTNAKAAEDDAKAIQFFQPYILRHAALTQLANSGCDVFTLARIAGHSSITITQRYVHPQADEIERASLQVEHAALPEPSSTNSQAQFWWVGTKLGTVKRADSMIGPKELVRKGGFEPPRVAPPDPKSGASANFATFAWFVLSLTLAGKARACNGNAGGGEGFHMLKSR
jgi:Phage integrase family